MSTPLQSLRYAYLASLIVLGFSSGPSIAQETGLDAIRSRYLPERSNRTDLPLGNVDADHKDENQPTQSKLSNDVVKRAFELINALRFTNGSKPVRLDQRLSKIAQEHATSMLNHSYFDHKDPQGRDTRTRARDAGVQCMVYENLGWQSGPEPDTEKLAELYQSFMSEPKNEWNHRSILLAQTTAASESALQNRRKSSI